MNKNSEQFNTLFSTVANANGAIIDDFLKNNKFVDNDKMMEKGLYADAVGLTGIMLTLVAFYGKDDGRVITPDMLEKYRTVVSTLIPEFYNIVNKDGYIFTPVIRKNITSKVFSAQNRIGYTDTATWVLSSAMLIRYACRKGMLNLNDAALDDKVCFLIFDSLKILLDSQREDGTWGFGTWAPGKDGQASKSLYFTYSVSASLADFFYYIKGEIDTENMEGPSAANEDHEMINYLNDHFGCDDIIKKVEDAREKMQDWLIRDCLPLLPKLASCQDMSDEEKASLGLFSGGGKDDSSGLNFFNLYYTFYIIDMLISSEVDLRYERLELSEIIGDVYDGSAPESAASGILTRFRDCGFFSANDRRNYLGLGSDDEYHAELQHIESLLEEYLQQAVHTSRAMFMVSKRARHFWDDSELQVEWNHDNKHINDTIYSMNGSFSDPAFAPMALRANADYVYYITRKPDSVLNDLFRSICDETFDEQRLREELGDAYEADEYEYCLPYLWDTRNYSLLVSERSLESLVDYFDYLVKYESGSVESGDAVEGPRSALDIAIDQKIEEIIRRHEADQMKKIDERISRHLQERKESDAPEPAPAPAVKAETVGKFLSSPAGKEAIIQALRDYPALAQGLTAKKDGETADSVSSADEFIDSMARKLSDVYSDSTPPEASLEKLITLYDELRGAWVRKQIRTCLENSNGNSQKALSGTALNTALSNIKSEVSKQNASIMEELFLYLYQFRNHDQEAKYALDEIVEKILRFANMEKFSQ